MAAVGYFQFSLTRIEALVVGCAVFAVLLALTIWIAQRRSVSQLRAQLSSYRQFERDVAGRLRGLESASGAGRAMPPAGGAGRSPAAAPLLSDLAGAPTLDLFASTEPALGDEQTAADGADGATNIIHLDPSGRPPRGLPAGGEPANDRASQPTEVAPTIAPAAVAKAVKRGDVEIVVQPVVELPTREVRYLEAFTRMRFGKRLATAHEFMAAARERSLVAQIDLLALKRVIALVRGLDRQDASFPVFWNLSRRALAARKTYDAIHDLLAANKSLKERIICELPHKVYEKLSTNQADNLARIRDLGFRLSIDHAEGTQAVSRLVTGGLFQFVKIPADALMRMPGTQIDNLADVLVPLAREHSVTLIASHAGQEHQVVGLIDADVFLAQGDVLAPARPVRADLSAPQPADEPGDAEAQELGT